MIDRQGQRGGMRAVVAGAVANALLIAVKFALGIVGRSQALIADAVHSVTDFATDIMAFAGLRYAGKERDRDHPFGHGKIETLMSLLIGVALVLAAAWIAYAAVAAIVAEEINRPNAAALVGALVSIAVKESLYHYTVRAGRRIRSQVLIANAWHHRSDALSSVAVLIGVGAALVNPDWAILDAVAALVVALLIVKVGFDIIVPAFRSASDAAPDSARLAEIERAASAVPGVRAAHDVRARYYSNLLYVEVHIVVDPSISVSEGHGIADAVRRRISDSVLDILDVIVHVDPDEGEAALPRDRSETD